MKGVTVDFVTNPGHVRLGRQYAPLDRVTRPVITEEPSSNNTCIGSGLVVRRMSPYISFWTTQWLIGKAVSENGIWWAFNNALLSDVRRAVNPLRNHLFFQYAVLRFHWCQLKLTARRAHWSGCSSLFWLRAWSAKACLVAGQYRVIGNAWSCFRCAGVYASVFQLVVC